jgi:hypothetical protein
MPWKECSVMDERLRFVARLLEDDFSRRWCLGGDCTGDGLYAKLRRLTNPLIAASTPPTTVDPPTTRLRIRSAKDSGCTVARLQEGLTGQGTNSDTARR